MLPPKISLFASAARPIYWERFYNSLAKNKVSFEVVFVGPNPPQFKLPENFTYFQSVMKPCQCYEAASRMCRGELIGWTADDGDYNHPTLNCPDALDRIWLAYLNAASTKVILSQTTVEDGNDVTENHRLFFGKLDTPCMAPLGFMNREWFRSLGGYDRNFVCGQSENDIVMRALKDGGRVEWVRDSKIYLHHSQCHGEYQFRGGYANDRRFLESCWIKEGYGCFENNLPYTVLTERAREFEPFSSVNLLTVHQGPTGRWQ